MQIVCGIKTVRNTTITETVQPQMVKALLASCVDADEFQQRAFHVISRKWKKEGVVVFPAEFRGLKEYWEAYSPHTILSDEADFDYSYSIGEGSTLGELLDAMNNA
jgi:hypothetical protein